MLQITIPSESASRSKMQKKGWKCWAKELTSVASPANNGFAFEGEFLSPGTEIEADLGAVILHVDQSSTATIGVVAANASGNGCLVWLADAGGAGRGWCAPLGRMARRLLAMSVDDRIAEVAQRILSRERAEPLKPSVEAHWRRLAGESEPPAPSEPATIIVSRHPAAIEFAREALSLPADCPVFASAAPEDVRGKHVVGNLPLSLAALAASVSAIEFSGDPPRGQEYTVEQMRAAGARVVKYTVALA